jgi:hypothetical protein
MFYRVDPIGLDSLGASPVRCETPFFDYWISLDFLGISRQNRDLSMGYAGSIGKKFSRAFSPGASAQPHGGLTLGARRYGSLMGQAYPDFGLAAINCRLSQSFRSVRSRIEEAGIIEALT